MSDLNRIEKHVLDLPLDVKADGEPGVFEGYGAIFGNLDRDGDIVAKGAFTASLQGRLPALLWQHNAKEPIGKFDEVREDDKGLYVRGRLSLQGRGREAYELLKMGALDGLSIGFITKEASKDALTGARTIKRAELMEISLVTFPANELARVSAVKADGGVPETKEAFIRMLTDHGMTAHRATAIARGGFRTLSNQVSDMICDLKSRESQLNQFGARHSDCCDCLPCQTKSSDQRRCDALKNDIVDGNRSRWKAWSDFEKSLQTLKREARRFSEKYERDLAISAVSTVMEVVEAAVWAALRRPKKTMEAMTDAAASIVDLLQSLYNYNGRFRQEFQREVGPALRRVDSARRRAVYLDDIFWRQVRAFQNEGCSGLHGHHFNRQ